MDTVLRKFFRCGTTAVLALVSGEVPISQVAGPAAVNSALAGSDIVMVAARPPWIIGL